MTTTIKVKEGNEKLTSHGGVIHTGTLLGATDLKPRLDNLPGLHLTNPDYSNSDIVFSMLGLISIGKPNYDAIELFRLDPSLAPSTIPRRKRKVFPGHIKGMMVLRRSLLI